MLETNAVTTSSSDLATSVEYIGFGDRSFVYYKDFCPICFGV